ncbi:MAG: creatininase family protein, partial [Rikenellaceae bacterium]
ATEPHNYHLPYGTDALIAHQIALRASEKAYALEGVKCMVLPSIPFGQQNKGQHDLPFCLNVRSETQKAILFDIVESLECQGFDKLLIINGHGGNSFKSMIRDMAIDFPDFTILLSNWFDVEPQTGYFENPDNHAGEMETSAMMHYFPDMVDLSTAGSGASKEFAIASLREGVAWTPRDWSKVSADTGVGDPSKSTAEKGRLFTSKVEDKIAHLLIDLTKCNIYH